MREIGIAVLNETSLSCDCAGCVGVFLHFCWSAYCCFALICVFCYIVRHACANFKLWYCMYNIIGTKEMFLVIGERGIMSGLVIFSYSVWI